MTTRSDILVSVILCAHNPREAHFRATLDGLKAQDLPFENWELLLVDNASTSPLSSTYSLEWHPNGRILCEPEPGLARARRRGYLEARGELIVHSDDDNILAPDYLSKAWEIQGKNPHIGTFGGAWVPRFDRPPASALEESFGGARTVERDVWSNIPDDNRTMPWGAGMCLRRAVIREYLAQVEKDPRRLVLGRTGNRFITGEDVDLNYVSVRLGLGTGLFRALSLTHLIPAERMTAEHVIRYGAGNAYSMVILHFLHLGRLTLPSRGFPQSLLFWTRVWLRMSPFQRRLELAMHKARKDACRDIHAWGWTQVTK